jgi:cobalamin biosynthesis protein CobD/CbiB
VSLFSLLAALLLDHFRPLSRNIPLDLFARYASHLERHFNAGERSHGIIAWTLAVFLPTIMIAAAYGVLYHFGSLFAWVFAVAVLYATASLRQISDNAESIAAALRTQELDQARRRLAQWQGRPADEYDAGQIARVGLEQVLASSHRQLFGTVIWFVVLGPAGAVLYRLSQLLSQKWGGLDEREFGDFGKFAASVFRVLDWVPLRLTAISFAIVGDFEDAVYCWRTQAQTWADQGLGIVLASGAGALGVKLGDPVPSGGAMAFRPELGLGDEADADYLESAMSLVWRAIVLWLVLLLLLTIARWAGG